MSSLRQAVVIATTGHRPDLLRRAVSSVHAPLQAPHRLLLVVDAPRPDAVRIVEELRARWPHAEVLHNRRTRGACGAWNSAIDHLLRTEVCWRAVLVSFLDDDDHWAAGYLDEVRAVADRTGAEVVGATLVRHDARMDGQPYLVQRLAASDFLVGNPGLQQTNLSIRLETLGLAGCFDEALPSCTDRDLCIRLADLGASYAAAPSAIAHHDTLHGMERLSDPTNPRKRAGLDAFYAKYRARMTDEERGMHVARAARLFNWAPPAEESLARSASTTRRAPGKASSPVHLVVGVIVDGSMPGRAAPLVDGLARLADDPTIDRLDLVILQNGPAAGFLEIARRAESTRLHTWAIDRDTQRVAGQELGLSDADLCDSKTIAVARTLLQRFVHQVAHAHPSAVAWILDDDSRLSIDGTALAETIHEARARGVSVAIGDIVGAPPVPSSSTLRVQLVDLFHFLAVTAHKQPDDAAPDTSDNARWRAGRRDYYYDLARSETDRLETPFVPDDASATVGDAVRKLVAQAPRILAGELVTRSIHIDASGEWRATHLRGGNTVVLDLDLLRDVANLSPSLNGRRVRRSDMIWALHAAGPFGRLVARAPITVTQDRTLEPARMEDPRKLVEDIVGYAFFHAYEEAPDGDCEALRRTARKLAQERVAAYRLSFLRARGVVRALRRLACSAPWWADDPTVRANLDGFLAGCDDALKDARLEAIVDGVDAGVAQLAIEAFLAERDRLSRPNTRELPCLERWARAQRDSRARELLRANGVEVDALLGMGSEGVVARTGDRVFKVFDAWSKQDALTHTATLERLVGAPCEAFPLVHGVHVFSGAVVLEYAYEESEPYRGGRGPGLLAALRALHAAGWVHTNVHPKNLRTTATGVRLIDLGRSVAARSDLGEELMIRRAFLAWRFWFRGDLDALMRRSNADDSFVELVGWRALLDGVRQPPAKARLDCELERQVAASNATRVLDFGAGKPRPIHDRHADRSWLAFDVDSQLAARWTADAPWALYLDEPALESMISRGARVDAVVCSLVLCALDDREMKHALTHLRDVVEDRGVVWVAVCDPTSVHVEVSADYVRRASCASYRVSSSYSKLVRALAVERIEHHRPLAAYRRAFARAGLEIENELVVDGLDAGRFEPVSEFRIFQLCPLPRLPCSASLLIKVCGMDAETMTASIEHLVGQLGRPRGFQEVVVALDPRAEGFARPHRTGDLARVRADLGRLLAAGVIDRVVEGPSNADAARALAREWFGLDVRGTHAVNGQPTLAILAGLAACHGDLVLHADVDVLIARPDPHLDLIDDARAAFDADTTAVALSLPVYGDVEPLIRHADVRGPLRVDAMCGWIHRRRLLALRPLPNEVHDGALALPWHRAVDRTVRDGRARSLRKGARGVWFTAPDNARKVDVDAHLLLLDRVEAGHAPDVQAGRSEVVGSAASWCGPARTERVVVVVLGRNVSPGRVRRCLDSLRAQVYRDWGAIVIDDASDNGVDEVVVEACRALGSRATVFRRRRRVRLLANLVLAVRRMIADPDAIVVTLDLDDALTPDALARIVSEHDRGADVTVGSMVRTDKEARYEVDFADPRRHRGGNVWQHARSFRKSLFDQIDVRDLQLDGRYVELSTDWSFMIPIAEFAARPVWIREPIYLHEPSGPRDAERAERERTIGALVRKRPYRGRDDTPSLTVLAYHRVADGRDATLDVYRARGMVVSPTNLESHLRSAARAFEPVRLSDVERAFRDGVALPPRALLVTLDDGYVDAERAVTVLLKLGFPAALFVRRPAFDGWPTWAPLDLLYHTRTMDGPAAIDAREREAMLAWPLDEQLRYAGAGVVRETADAWRRALYVHAGRLRDLVGPDVELGAHGTEHVRWTSVDDETLHADVEQALTWLSTFPCHARSVAYPDGFVDERVARIVRTAGATLGFTIGTARGCLPARFAISRLIPGDDPNWLVTSMASQEVES